VSQEQRTEDPQPGGSAQVAERVRAIMAAAEETASTVRAEAEREAEAVRQRAEAALEAARREAAEKADREVELRLRRAEDEATRYEAEARRRADAFAADRMRRVTELSDQIADRAQSLLERLERAHDLRRQLDGLSSAISEAIERLTEDVQEGAEEATTDTRGATSLEAARRGRIFRRAQEPSEDRADRVPAPREVENARLIALQMKVAGSGRSEVEDHLRKSLRVEDPTPVLDAVFGEVKAERRS
jgi:gas vesicle protein